MRELRRDHARKLLLAVANDGCRGLVTGTLDAQDQCHISISP
jgi:hypothetical protein